MLLVNQLQRKLNLPRRTRGPADDPEPAAAHNVIRQSKVHNVEDVEQFSAKFDCPQFSIIPMTEGSLFDQRNIKVMKRRSAESISSKRPKAAQVRPRSPSNVDRNKEEILIVVSLSKVILTDLATSGEVRH